MTSLRGGRRPQRPIAWRVGTASPAQAGAHSQRAGIEAHYHRLRLLDFPAERHHHVLRLLRHLRGAGRQHGRGTERPGAVQPAQCRARDGVPARLELHLSASQASVPRRVAGPGSMARWPRPSSLEPCFLASRSASSRAWPRAGQARRGARSSRPFLRLVGCHGLHITVGLLWLLTMMAQVFAKGYRADILRRMLCFSLFWHALDIIWVAIFTVVYLMGAAQ